MTWKAPERVTTPRSDNDRDLVGDGVGVDDEREHQPVREDTPRSESV